MIQSSEQPLVSCIIAVLNGEAYLHEAIDSLLAQTYPAIEIIVVNDGSTDRTADVVAGYGNRVRLLNQENRGVSVARNRGVTISTGSLLCFLDADDLLESKKIALQAAKYEANQQLQFCDCHTSYFWTPEMSQADRAADFRHAEPFWRTPLPGHISTWLFRREVWHRVGEFSAGQRYAEDVDWFVRGRDLGFPRLTLPDVLTLRRLHANNVTTHSPGKQISDLASTLKAHLARKRLRNAG
jgi:glycosyltransferase involved in cell wall biosynthesis